MIILQEGDELVYRCAFAHQKQAYKVVFPKKTYDLKSRYTKTQITQLLSNKNKKLDEDYTLEPYVILDPEEFVKHTVKNQIAALYDISDKITDVQIWLSSSTVPNFREKVATIPGPNGVGYKAGRGTRPHYYSLVREYLITKFNAQEIHGFEADDALGMFATNDTILSHIDKDINMVPGQHYNYVTQAFYRTDETELGELHWDEDKQKLVGGGVAFFYAQLLMGDRIDNIPGCLNISKAHFKKIPNMSPKETYNLLKYFNTEQELFSIVAAHYQFTYGDNYTKALEEIADLIWICRSNDETGSQYLKNKKFI